MKHVCGKHDCRAHHLPSRFGLRVLKRAGGGGGGRPFRRGSRPRSSQTTDGGPVQSQTTPNCDSAIIPDRDPDLVTLAPVCDQA